MRLLVVFGRGLFVTGRAARGLLSDSRDGEERGGRDGDVGKSGIVYSDSRWLYVGAIFIVVDSSGLQSSVIDCSLALG